MKISLHKSLPVKSCAPLVGAAFLIAHASVFASGVTPSTSVVIVNEADGEGSILFRNTDQKPLLLTSVLRDIPEDKGTLLFVTPAVARIEPGHEQLVRFILRNDAPLNVEHLRRVIFDGVPPKLPDGERALQLVVAQNLPVIIHPAGLAVNREPWKGLTWTTDSAGALNVDNPTP